MERKTKITLAVVAAVALGGAVAIPVLAHGTGNGMWRQMSGESHMQGGDMMQGAGEMGNHAGMMQMMMQMHGNEGGMMDAQFSAFDADGDGTVTPEELSAGLQDRLKQYDADGNGTLSLDEYASLFADESRPRMVDRFQAFDEDGNGQVTADEFQKPAERFQHMQDAFHGTKSETNGGMMDEG